MGRKWGKLRGVRAALALAVAAAALMAAQAGAAPSAYECQPTINDGSGPFGRGMPPVRAKIGRGHVLTGIVLSAVNCAPLARAQVQIWYRGKNGYTRATSATVMTGKDGRFRFESGRPQNYGPPPHFHLRIVAPNHEVLQTRFSVTGRRGNMRLVLLPIEL